MVTNTTILPGDDPVSIEHAAEVLRAGGLIGMPTETVYGLAADALDPAAVAKVFEAKQRPSFDPLIVHVPSADKAEHLAVFDNTARRLAQAFWPGPMTLVLPRQRDTNGNAIVPDLVTAGLDSVGVRVPNHPVALALLEVTGAPLAAPSANRFGSISPTAAQHVVDELDGKVVAVLDGGSCERGLESTVVRVVEGVAEVLRLGALPVEAIDKALGTSVTVRPPSSSPGKGCEGAALPAPGMVDRHYAPGTPMRLVDTMHDLTAADTIGRVGLIGVGDLSSIYSGFTAVHSLSVSGDLTQAAANLFQTLREMDSFKLDRIIVIKALDEGLGRAINDRLRRGSTK